MAESEGFRKVVRTRYWREEHARVVLDAWRESGDSLAGFCRAHGIARARLSRWAAQLGDSALRFHPVRLTNGGGTTPQPGIEIELAGGTTIRLPAGFAHEDLQRVLSALSSATGC